MGSAITTPGELQNRVHQFNSGRGLHLNPLKNQTNPILGLFRQWCLLPLYYHRAVERGDHTGPSDIHGDVETQVAQLLRNDRRRARLLECSIAATAWSMVGEMDSFVSQSSLRWAVSGIRTMAATTTRLVRF